MKRNNNKGRNATRHLELPMPSSYMDGIDLPPSVDEEDEANIAAKPRSTHATVDHSVAALSRRNTKKKDRREHEAAAHAAASGQEALRDDRDAFSVVIGGRVPAPYEYGDAASNDDNVRDIVLESFSVSARGVKLLDDASLSVSHGRRYGLVGPNGKGKSTLLRLLAWQQLPVPRNMDVLLVEQEVVADDRSAIEAVVAADVELAALRDERDRLEAANNDDDSKRLADLYDKLNLHGSDTARARASKILAGLGFDQAMQARATKSFSGGWRMRISLACALFMQPTLLLLDEPTNHLDLRAVLWLEEYLSTQWKNTLIVVSHDRDFLNTVCNNVIHLHGKKLDAYRGNFDDFEAGFKQKRTQAIRKHDTYMKAARARGGGNKTAKHELQKQNQDQQPVVVPPKWHDYNVKFFFPEPTQLPRPLMPLLQLSEAGFSYPGRPDFKLSGVSASIDMGTRVAIVGPNGAGKSTLLKLLAGELAPTEGEVRRSCKISVGRYSQHFVDVLTMEENAVEYLLRIHPEQEGMSRSEAVRARLGKFGLPKENHLVPIAKLSGGQKARVVFTSIAMGRPHVLLLDEPTNHLDMQSIDALANALDEFTGGVVLVSHDAQLISLVCKDETTSQVWVVQDGTATTFDGTFEDYKEDLMDEIKEEMRD